MRTVQGPAIFLAQFMGDDPPYNKIETIADWVASLGYVGVQIPSWDKRAFDLEKAASSKSYCDDYKGMLAKKGLQITELSTHLQGQLVAVHPAYDELFDGFADPSVRGNPKARTEWAVDQVKKCLRASKHLGLSTMATFSGALAWPYFYPWPQRPKGLVEDAFAELARRWRPLLDAGEECGVDCAFEVHPGEDLHDGVSFEMFLKETGNHKRVHMVYDPSHFMLQHLDYLQYIDLYHPYIKVFHVKDAELNYNGRSGVYGGYQPWSMRAGRFRSTGDGDIDFMGIFSKLALYDYPGWAVLEWECCLKSPEQGAKEGAPFIRKCIIQTTAKAFDDFAASGADQNFNRKVLGLGR